MGRLRHAGSSRRPGACSRVRQTRRLRQASPCPTPASRRRTVDILVGGKVNFSYPSGTGVYNVVWDRGSLEPATCEQTQGTVWGYGTTLPWWMQAAPWAGNCTFTKPGTYTYHSGVDPDKMKGTVVVHAEATPTATPTVTATPTATPSDARIEAHDSASPAAQLVPGRDGRRQRQLGDDQGGREGHVRVPRRDELAQRHVPERAQAGAVPADQGRERGPVPRSRQRAADARLRAARRLGGQLHLRRGRHVHVRLLHAPGDDGHGRGRGRRRADADADRHPDADGDADRDADDHARGPRRDRRARPDRRRRSKNWFQDASSTDPADNSVSVNKRRDGRLQLSGRARARTTSCSRRRRPPACRRRASRSYPAPPLPAFAQPRGLERRVHVRHARASTRSCARRTRPR